MEGQPSIDQTGARIDNERPTCIIRRIKPADFPATALVSARSMMDEDAYQITAPKREEHFDHFLNGFYRRLVARYWQPGSVVCVAVTESDEGEKIIGHAAWQRIGNTPTAKAWKRERRGWWSRLQFLRCRITNLVYNLFRLDKSIDRVKIQNFLPALENNFPPEIFPDIWYVAFLGVDPEYQGKGIGRRLMQEGIDRAMAENVPIGLEATRKGFWLYEKMGFRTFNTKVPVGMENLPCPIMVWEPPGLSPEESWYEKAKKAASNN
ncbi:hypothetical protein FQN57_000164 [Myotisia sp. PD_48]|nr:hypothetical protein FQN57_000164 [Myotisia sp. PD_48]